MGGVEVTTKLADQTLANILDAATQALKDSTVIYDSTNASTVSISTEATEIYEVAGISTGGMANTMYIAADQDVFGEYQVATVEVGAPAASANKVVLTLAGLGSGDVTVTFDASGAASDDSGGWSWKEEEAVASGAPGDVALYDIDYTSGVLTITSQEKNKAFTITEATDNGGKAGNYEIVTYVKPADESKNLYIAESALTDGQAVKVAQVVIKKANAKTAQELLDAIAQADADLASHEATYGDNEAMLATLETHLGALLQNDFNQGSKKFNGDTDNQTLDLSSIVTTGDTPAGTHAGSATADLGGLKNTITAVLAMKDEKAKATQVDALVAKLYAAKLVPYESDVTSIQSLVNDALAEFVERKDLARNANVYNEDGSVKTKGTAQTTFEAAAEGDTFTAIKEAYDARQKLIEQKADAADTEALDGLIQAVKDAIDDLNQKMTDLGYDKIEEIKTAADVTAKADAEVFVFDAKEFASDKATAAADFNLKNLAAGDALLLAGFEHNEGDVASKATNGNNGVLEFWLEEITGGLKVTYETQVYGSASTTDVQTITLQGVTDYEVDGGVILIG